MYDLQVAGRLQGAQQLRPLAQHAQRAKGSATRQITEWRDCVEIKPRHPRISPRLLGDQCFFG